MKKYLIGAQYAALVALLMAAGAVMAQTSFTTQLPAISVVSGSANLTALTGTPSQQVFLFNEGTAEVFWLLGDQTVAATATTGIPLPAGCGMSVKVGPSTYLSTRTAASTATVRVTQGASVPNSFCFGPMGGTYTFNGAVTATVPVPAIAPQVSADSVSNFVPTAAGKTLFGFTVKNTSTAGWVVVFDATSLPSNGAAAPKVCFALAANTSVTYIAPVPMLFATGITLGYSSTSCDSITASATAKFSGVQVQ